MLLQLKVFLFVDRLHKGLPDIKHEKMRRRFFSVRPYALRTSMRWSRCWLHSVTASSLAPPNHLHPLLLLNHSLPMLILCFSNPLTISRRCRTWTVLPANTRTHTHTYTRTQHTHTDRQSDINSHYLLRNPSYATEYSPRCHLNTNHIMHRAPSNVHTYNYTCVIHV